MPHTSQFYLPSLVYDSVTHPQSCTGALVWIWNLIDVRTGSTVQVVITNSCRKQFVCATVGAGAYPTARLWVSSSVGVEVRVGNTVEDTKKSTISMNCLNVLAIISVQSIWVSTPLRSSGVQSCKYKTLLHSF